MNTILFFDHFSDNYFGEPLWIKALIAFISSSIAVLGSLWIANTVFARTKRKDEYKHLYALKGRIIIDFNKASQKAHKVLFLTKKISISNPVSLPEITKQKDEAVDEFVFHLVELTGALVEIQGYISNKDDFKKLVSTVTNISIGDLEEKLINKPQYLNDVPSEDFHLISKRIIEMEINNISLKPIIKIIDAEIETRQ